MKATDNKRTLPSSTQTTTPLSRRQFIKTSAAASLAALGAGSAKVFAAGSDTIRVGVIGCGGRGRYDTTNCLSSAENVELVAMADLFKDRLGESFAKLSQRFPDKFKVTKDKCFVGWDAYKQLIECEDVDLVILTTPPHFRPQYLRAALEAGKHVFAEKPVAVDPVGVRHVIESADLADRKGLTVVAGTQMRRIAHLVAAMEKIHNGDIGEILAGQCVRIGSGMLDWGPAERKAEWSEMEWQLRRWLFVNWLSGDLIVEQHVHNLDVINWALQAHPVKCVALGGRQVRTGPEFGDIFDHFSVEYEYPNGARIEYMGAQIDGCTDRNDQRLAGTKGFAYLDFAIAKFTGQNEWQYDGPAPSPVIKQHADHIDAIRSGKHLNEAKRIAESTLTAMMGRMSAYTGRALSWDWAMNASQLDLTPESHEFGPAPKLEVPVPGKTPLI